MDYALPFGESDGGVEAMASARRRNAITGETLAGPIPQHHVKQTNHAIHSGMSRLSSSIRQSIFIKRSGGARVLAAFLGLVCQAVFGRGFLCRRNSGV
jgi:hypothetical protein